METMRLFFHGKFCGYGSNAYDLLFRHYPTYNTYQDQAQFVKTEILNAEVHLEQTEIGDRHLIFVEKKI